MLCDSYLELEETETNINYNILDIIKGKSKRFINSLKSYLKEASSRLGDIYWHPYNVLIGELPDRFKFQPVIDGRFFE